MEAFLFGDDFVCVADRQRQVETIGFFIFVLVALGTPFRWDKFRGGPEIGWIGYQVDWFHWALEVSEKRGAWMATWLRDRMLEGQVDLGDLESVLGTPASRTTRGTRSRRHG